MPTYMLSVFLLAILIVTSSSLCAGRVTTTLVVIFNPKTNSTVSRAYIGSLDDERKLYST